MNHRLIVFSVLFFVSVFAVVALQAKEKPLIIVNATGSKQLIVVWCHAADNIDLFSGNIDAYHLNVGKDIRQPNWNISDETYLFIALRSGLHAEANNKISVDGYLYRIPENKAINLKVVSRSIGGKDSILLVPNAMFGDLKDSDLMLQGVESIESSVRDVKKNGKFPTGAIKQLVFKNIKVKR